MSLLNIPILVVATAANVWLLASVVRRLLGVRFSLTRMILAASLSWFSAPPILRGLRARAARPRRRVPEAAGMIAGLGRKIGDH